MAIVGRPLRPQRMVFQKEVASRLYRGVAHLDMPLASSTHTPATPLIAEEFSTSASRVSLTVAVYVLGFAAGPFLWLPLSKLYGRLPVYNAANVLLLIGSIVCALAPALAWLVVFRFVAGSAAACALTQGSGTIADIIAKEERGKTMSIMAFGTVWAPSIGPAIGGRVAEAFGWRACFWLLAFLVSCGDEYLDDGPCPEYCPRSHSIP
ncbi:major facilitator superfamily domain-containing protein [Clohesyomyces aquaticus]|uniref:Major facilitator superfamily domain-containing protein n=1 Tax=Clohesyomyces aquaticus TaxID=1231657 RepID=A0A1Y1ZHV6_9PLEO|nr:major facilitator superfamily domain-containing protein [Clohesyomyces aquaticus]